MEKVLHQRLINKKNSENFHNVQELVFDRENMILKVDGKTFKFKLKDISGKLSKASQKEKEAYKIICSGYGISWPLIDEDLSITALINKK